MGSFVEPGAVLIEVTELTVDDVRIMVEGSSQQMFIGIRLQAIIAVHQGNVGAGGNAKSGISGGGGTAVLLVQGEDPAVELCVAVADRTTAIRGAVIDQNDLKIRIGLAEQTFDAFGQIFFDSVNGDDHRNQAAFFHNNTSVSFDCRAIFPALCPRSASLCGWAYTDMPSRADSQAFHRHISWSAFLRD